MSGEAWTQPTVALGLHGLAICAFGQAWTIGPLTGSYYLVQVAAGAGPVPTSVALLRASVLTAIGLATWSAGQAYRASTHVIGRSMPAADVLTWCELQALQLPDATHPAPAGG